MDNRQEKLLKKNICGYQVTISYKSNPEEVHFIYYEQTRQDRIYQKKIQIRSHSQLKEEIKKNFKNLEEFFNYVVLNHENQNVVDISNAGYFRIRCYGKNKSKNNISKAKYTIQFDGMHLMNQQQKQEVKQIKTQCIDVRAQNAYLRETYQILVAEYRRNREKIEKLEKTLKEDTHYKQIKQKAMKKVQNSRRQERKKGYIHISELTKFNEAIDTWKEKLGQLMFQIKSRQVKPISAKDIVDQEDEDYQRYGDQFWVEIDDNNNKYFEGNYIKEGYKLTKIGVYGSFQVLGRDPIPSQRRYYFSVFIGKATASIFSLGICHIKRRNAMYSHESPDCITYFAKNGTIWHQGISKGGGPVIPNGVEIRVMVDFIKNMIKWFQDGVEIGSIMIEQNMQKTRVMPYIQLNYPGNWVLFNGKSELNSTNDQ